MNLHLSGQHVLVTGGSKGIGLACARLFLEEGCVVTLVSRGEANLKAARDQLVHDMPGSDARIRMLAADVSQPEAALAMVAAAEALGAIDVLVNSAGAAQRTAVAQLDAAGWAAAMQAKYFATLHVLDPVAKRMAARGRGAIVNIVGAGGKHPFATHLPGGAANAALMLVSTGMANVYAPQGVRINALNPGSVMTERSMRTRATEAAQAGVSVEEAVQRLAQKLPLGRICTPEEVAAAAVFLASPRASYISGATLTIDGALNPCVV